MLQIYRGNRPENVSKIAKYAVVHGERDSFKIRLIYEIDRWERALLTAEDHPELVEMVNRVKTEAIGTPGGAFYINEHSQVIVPAGGEYYFAGTYTRQLEFKDGSTRISAAAPGGLKPGDAWPGPRPGIPYVLNAGATDIYYQASPAPNRIRRYPLSEQIGAPAAKAIAASLAKFKGSSGGRIYVNEARELFAPVPKGSDYEYIYLGSLGHAPWYPAGTGNAAS
jgi:hypothetical protein